MTRVLVSLACAALAAPVLAQPSPRSVPTVIVVGCLAQAADGTWSLTDATEPEAVKGKPGSKELWEPDATVALGKNRFRLIGTLDEFGAPKHKGHKVRVRGLLIEAQPESRVNITSLRHLAPACQ